MVLTIDIGNTKTKVAVFDGEQLVEHIVFECFSKGDIDLLVSRFKSFDGVIISSVNANEENRIAQLLDEFGIKCCLLSYKLHLPFVIDYLTPETLGKDRIAALAGAYAVGGEGNYLVIDCGTCNTYDLLVDGHFVGGNIAPGIQMRLDAMHHFTAALPQCFIENAQCSMLNAQLGLTTHSALSNGAYWGIVHEINGYIERYSREYDGLKVILTGGLFNLPIADYRLQITNDNVELLFEPMLVPKGLNYIANSFE
jgi:type III pantothenate kinase